MNETPERWSHLLQEAQAAQRRARNRSAEDRVWTSWRLREPGGRVNPFALAGGVVAVVLLVAVAAALVRPPHQGPAPVGSPSHTSSPVPVPPSGFPTSTPSPAPTPNQATQQTADPGRTLEFVSELRGWAIAASPGSPTSGTMLGTTDGGHTWKTVYTTTTGNLQELAFIDAQRGWMIVDVPSTICCSTAGQLLLRTSDGGAHWHSLGTPAPFLQSLHFTTSQLGWAISKPYQKGGETTGPDLVATHDGGASWRLVQPAQGGSAVLPAQALCFSDVSHGWLAFGSTVLHTGDGGRSWQHAFTAPGDWWSSALGCSGNSVWWLARDGVGMSQEAYVAFRSLDGGATWKAVLQAAELQGQGGPLGSSGPTEQIDAYSGPVAVRGPSDAYFFGSCAPCDQFRTSLAATHDDGSSWRHITVLGGSVPGGTPLDASFGDADHGWLALQLATDGRFEILATADAGLTWTLQYRAP